MYKKYLSLSLGAEAVPHGIDLLTTCDYHSVGIRAHAYTGKSCLEALILAITNPQYDKRLFIELQVQ